MSAAVATAAPTRLPTRALARRIWRSYALRRIGKSLVTLYLVVSLSFFLVRFMPGNPLQANVQNLMSTQGMSYQDALNQVSSLITYHLNEPLYQQYLDYIGHLARGDMGQSITSPGTSVSSEVFTYLPWTLFSVGVGLLLSFVIGVLLGTIAAYRRGSWFDHLVTNLSSLLHAIPNYIWAMVVLVVFGVQLGLFNVTSMRGTHSPGVTPGVNLTFLSDVLYHAALPILVYALTSVGGWVLTMKSSTLQVLDEDFVTVARARGLHESRVRTRYVGRNAVLPLFSQLALSVGLVVGGSTLIEQIFQYNGVGFYLYDSITKRDYPVMQGFILVMTVAVIAANLVADLLLARIDPRIRVGDGENR